MTDKIVDKLNLTGIAGYEHALEAHREHWEQSDTMRALLNPEASAQMVYLTYLQYCSIGTQLTRPVEQWIYRAGERCLEIGMEDLGTMLKKHSVHEKNHDRLMETDTHRLVERWNELNPAFPLDAKALLAQPESEVAVQYTALHEDAINSDAPYAQIAIEYEIERLSVVLGPRLLDHVSNRCGKSFIECLSFLDDHVRIDVAHTELNQKQLDAFLKEHPETLDVLVYTGKRALDTYMSFFQECLSIAADRYLKMVGH